jgi:hypothetical protein
MRELLFLTAVLVGVIKKVSVFRTHVFCTWKFGLLSRVAEAEILEWNLHQTAYS